MAKSESTWQPRFSITPAMAQGLMAIETSRAALAGAGLPPTALAEPRRRTQIRSTHYSTRIEGNRLTLAEASEAVAGHREGFQGRQRDVAEVLHYWKALQRSEEWAETRRPISGLRNGWNSRCRWPTGWPYPLEWRESWSLVGSKTGG